MARHRLMYRSLAAIGEGAYVGVIATMAMTAVMFAAQAAGLLGGQPPARITAALLHALHMPPKRGPLLGILTTVLHLGFGASLGGLFGLLHRSVRVPLASALQGIIYGGLIWVGSYAGWIPALGILPAPTRERPQRPMTMVLAHGVYGVTLGMIVGYRARRAQD